MFLIIDKYTKIHNSETDGLFKNNTTYLTPHSPLSHFPFIALFNTEDISKGYLFVS